jgi:hypothetical protein
MKKYNYILILIFILIFSGLVAGDTTRSCTAQYFVSIKPSDGTEGITYPSFTGQGTTTIFAPNTARKKARANLNECACSWRDQDEEERYCSETNQIYNYPFPEGLLTQITNDLCGRYPGHRNFIIDLNAVFQGDKGCLGFYPPDPRFPGLNNMWSARLATNYEITCPI